MSARRLTDSEVEEIKQSDPKRHYNIIYNRLYQQAFHAERLKREALRRAANREKLREQDRAYRQNKKARAATQAGANGTNKIITNEMEDVK